MWKLKKKCKTIKGQIWDEQILLVYFFLTVVAGTSFVSLVPKPSVVSESGLIMDTKQDKTIHKYINQFWKKIQRVENYSFFT